ncbi:MAG: undecaprenyl/decaprenyl-phosphate alpha-N-acetylglucosaminyl 1-phosphate transferase [Candidatus Limivicinus sp.]|nr:undecaprenyl/decaprenyl-phosphate alpha-N-acetylglucosaminyl 1-phosphate transferase [Candidatus Limivicinus sp.]
MFPGLADWIKILLAFALSLVIAFLMTPPVKRFAEKVGAIDVPKDDRRVHNHPIPRMGGLAIFMGFVLSLIVFVPMSTKVLGLLVGALIIAVMGGVDDIVCLNPWIKLLGQVIAALVAIRCGLVFDVISNPNIFAEETYIEIGYLSIPLTMLWIVACTNAVNLIDGLDGLAVGVSAISSLTMLIVSLFVSEPVVSLILAALTGACLGFMPYNLNPAKIFMGDVGSQLLGFVLSTVSIMGLFKLHAIITFFVPLLALALPLADTIFAFFRRILHGQSPFKADKGHFHHRLLAMGLNQKQVVAVLYGISAVLGLLAVLMAGNSVAVKIICLVTAFIISLVIWLKIFKNNPNLRAEHHAVHEHIQSASASDDAGSLNKKNP